MLPAVLVLTMLASASPRPTAYTNEDLDRIAPFRAETGGSNEARAAPTPARTTKTEPSRPGREPYWRDEARRVRQRMEKLDERVVQLRQRIEDRRSQKNVLPYSDPQIRKWDREVQDLVARGREMENDLLDRARREGALPGWLR